MKADKILVLTPNWIGDHVLARGLYVNLRSYYQDAEITFLSPESVSGMDDAGLCDRKISLPKNASRMSISQYQFAKILKAEKYDLGISLRATLGSASLLFFAAIPNRVGFYNDGNQLFLTAGINWLGHESKKHKSELYLSLFEYLTNSQGARTKISSSTAQRENLIIIAPGASIPLRVWPYFSELVQVLSATFQNFKIIFVGGKKESHWHTVLASLNLPNVEDRIEKTSLSELTTLCAKSRLVIANDSGVAHVAATLAGVPTAVLFGPGDPQYIEPIGTHVLPLRISLPCSPCESAHCRAPFGYKKCLNDLTVEQVVKELKSWNGFDTVSGAS